MRCTFGSMGSVRLMHESYVCGYLSILQALSCPSVLLHCVSLIKWLRWRQGLVRPFTRACLKWLLCSSDVFICLSGVMGWMREGALKSDKLLKIAFKQSFLFGHTWHIWLWSGNKSAVAGGSAHRVVPHITPSSSSNSSLLVWSANIEVQPPPHPSQSLWGAWSCWCLWWCLTVVPARAFLSSMLTLRISEGYNWGVCKDECSIMTLQAVHIFRGKSCSQSGNFKQSQ